MVGLVMALSSTWAVPAGATSLDLTMTSIGLSNQLGGVYIGPYTVLDDTTGQYFKVICDDFLAETYVGESWTAAVSALSDLTGKFANTAGAEESYDEVAFLATALLDSNSKCLLGPTQCARVNNTADIQYALWEIFDSSDTAFNRLGADDLANAKAWLSLAQNQTYSAGQFANVSVLTATACNNPSGGPGCSKPAYNLPQEFIAVRSVPEPPAILLFGMAVACLVAYRRRRPADSAPRS